MSSLCPARPCIRRRAGHGEGSGHAPSVASPVCRRAEYRIAGCDLSGGDARTYAGDTHRLQQSHGPNPGRVTRVLGLIEAHSHVRLRREIIDLVRIDLMQQGNESCTVGEISVVKEQRGVGVMWILVQMINS